MIAIPQSLPALVKVDSYNYATPKIHLGLEREVFYSFRDLDERGVILRAVFSFGNVTGAKSDLGTFGDMPSALLASQSHLNTLIK